jgi:hypothetical protein
MRRIPLIMGVKSFEQAVLPLPLGLKPSYACVYEESRLPTAEMAEHAGMLKARVAKRGWELSVQDTTMRCLLHRLRLRAR